MPRYRATLAYDGTAYQGFQRQASGIPTIQGAVEQAVRAVTRQQVTVWGAGRTDTGVHAVGQVIAFDVDWAHTDTALLRAVNVNLPPDIAVQDICQQEGFHPRFDALSRCYRYHVAQLVCRQPLLQNQTWQIFLPLDLVLMQQAAELLVGWHDFASFGTPPQGENTFREVMVSQWARQEYPYGVLYVYEVEATAFLYRMVRRMVGMLVDVGLGRASLPEFERIFQSRMLAMVKTTAPPQGLVLEKVRYPEYSGR